MSPSRTEKETPMAAVEIAKGLIESLGGKGFTLQSDAVTTNFSNCKPEVCSWQGKCEPWLLDSGYNWPFQGWIAYEVWVLIQFEYDGCDVNNARITLSPKCHTTWYNDKATFTIFSKGAASRITDKSGCPACCDRAAVVEFDITLDCRYDFVKADVLRWTVRLSGNGDIRITQIP